jgi:hypothetical protein
MQKCLWITVYKYKHWYPNISDISTHSLKILAANCQLLDSWGSHDSEAVNAGLLDINVIWLVDRHWCFGETYYRQCYYPEDQHWCKLLVCFKFTVLSRNMEHACLICNSMWDEQITLFLPLPNSFLVTMFPIFNITCIQYLCMYVCIYEW